MIKANVVPLTKIGAILLCKNSNPEDLLNWAEQVWNQIRDDVKMENVIYMYTKTKNPKTKVLERTGAMFNLCGIPCNVTLGDPFKITLKQNQDGGLFFYKLPFCYLRMYDTDLLFKIKSPVYDTVFIEQEKHFNYIDYYVNKKLQIDEDPLNQIEVGMEIEQINKILASIDEQYKKLENVLQLLKTKKPISKDYQSFYTFLYRKYNGNTELVNIAFNNIFAVEYDIYGSQAKDKLHSNCGKYISLDQIKFIEKKLVPELKAYEIDGKFDKFFPILYNINVINGKPDPKTMDLEMTEEQIQEATKIFNNIQEKDINQYCRNTDIEEIEKQINENIQLKENVLKHDFSIKTE